MPNVYITYQNMIDGLGASQLARILDVDESFDFSTSAMLSQKIAAANSLIDQYLGATVEVPVELVPPHLIEYGVAIATWFLVASRPEVQRDGDETRYNQAMSYLRDRKGTNLPGVVTVIAGARNFGSNSRRAIGASSTSTSCETVRILDPCVIPPDGRV